MLSQLGIDYHTAITSRFLKTERVDRSTIMLAAKHYATEGQWADCHRNCGEALTTSNPVVSCQRSLQFLQFPADGWSRPRWRFGRIGPGPICHDCMSPSGQVQTSKCTKLSGIVHLWLCSLRIRSWAEIRTLIAANRLATRLCANLSSTNCLSQMSRRPIARNVFRTGLSIMQPLLGTLAHKEKKPTFCQYISQIRHDMSTYGLSGVRECGWLDG